MYLRDHRPDFQLYFGQLFFQDVSVYGKPCKCTVCQLSSSKDKSLKVPFVSKQPVDMLFKRLLLDHC